MDEEERIASGLAGFLVADFDGTYAFDAGAARMDDYAAGTKFDVVAAAAVVGHLFRIAFAGYSIVDRS
jgi:hypothetical protein